MRLLSYLIIILSSIALTSVSSSRLNEFKETIHESYQEYYLFEKELDVGDLVICKGYVNNHYSISLYFANRYNEEMIFSITKDDKSYILSDENYQIFYDIKISLDSSYKISLISSKNHSVYCSYVIDDVELNQQGEGLNQFPYHTKLRNLMSAINKIFIFFIVLLVFEILIITFIILYKRHHKKKVLDQSHQVSSAINNIVYDSVDYQVEDDNNES